jgi:xanthine/CO dehydrogenase XdhC/CoxF family maturation factor
VLHLLVAHEQLAKSVEPTVAHLHDPAARLLARLPPLGDELLATVHDVGHATVPIDDPQECCAAVTGVGAQVFAAALGGHRALDRYLLEDLLQAPAVIHVGCAHDDRQRDATPVYQQVQLAPNLSPDPSGWAQRILVPSVP